MVVSTIRIEHRSARHPRARRPPPPPPQFAVLRSPLPQRPATQKRQALKKTAVSPTSSEQRRDLHTLALIKPSRDLAGAPSMSFTTNQTATLKVPVNWDKQDFANGAAADTTLWLDFKKARGAIVPRVFLLHLKTTYMSGPTLQDAVHDILGNLHAEGAKMYVSKAKTVCRGKRLGWFLSYRKPNDDPPLDFVDTLYVAGDTVYRATYSRPPGQPVDAKTIAALSTLCTW